MKQQEWVLTRKRLLRKIKAQVSERLGEPPASFRQYAEKLSYEFRGRWRVCEWADLLKNVEAAEVVFASDFHAHSQSQRAHLRLLRSLPEDRSVVLALECVCVEDAEPIDAYLRDEISDKEFLEQTEWTKVWGFPWEHYKPIFEFAKRKKMAIAGLSRRSDVKKDRKLTTRDERMAQDIADLAQRHPGDLVYVMVGELHLAGEHLPESFQRLKPDLQTVIVYQDAELLYFRLARAARDQNVDVLRSGNRFCIMVSPPWVKWQSYLMYLEQTFDRDLDEDGETLDYTDHVRQFAELLARDFDIDLDTDSLHVYTPNGKETLMQLRKNLPRDAWPVLQAHLENDRSFLLPSKSLIYLSSPTLNRAAHLAGEFLHARLSGRKSPLWGGMDDWEALIWTESLAFFFSKWINPKRKSRELALLSPKDRGRSALQLALDQRMTEVVWVKTGRKRSLRAIPRRRLDILEAARILGSQLGGRLFHAVRSDEISSAEIVEWAKVSVNAKDFSEFYRKVLKRL